jgi:IS5 family transposase
MPSWRTATVCWWIFQVTEASGTAEREMARQLVHEAKARGLHATSLGADKSYDARQCGRVAGAGRDTERGAEHQPAAQRHRREDHPTPHYVVSQRLRKRVEEIFGWIKTAGGFRQTRYRGLDRTGLAGYLVATAYNLVRLVKLLASAPDTALALA